MISNNNLKYISRRYLVSWSFISRKGNPNGYKLVTRLFCWNLGEDWDGMFFFLPLQSPLSRLVVLHETEETTSQLTWWSVKILCRESPAHAIMTKIKFFAITFNCASLVMESTKDTRSSPILLCKLQLVLYYQRCVLIGWASTRLYMLWPTSRKKCRPYL